MHLYVCRKISEAICWKIVNANMTCWWHRQTPIKKNMNAEKRLRTSSADNENLWKFSLDFSDCRLRLHFCRYSCRQAFCCCFFFCLVTSFLVSCLQLKMKFSYCYGFLLSSILPFSYDISDIIRHAEKEDFRLT